MVDRISKKYLPGVDKTLGVVFDLRDGKVDIVGRTPQSKTIRSADDWHLDEVMRYLGNIRIKYPFIEFEPDAEVVAIRVWHKEDPDVVFAVSKGTDITEHISGEVNRFPCLLIEAWSIDDSSEDRTLAKMSIEGPSNSANNTYNAALFIGMEVLRTDFALTGYHAPSKK